MVVRYQLAKSFGNCQETAADSRDDAASPRVFTGDGDSVKAMGGVVYFLPGRSEQPGSDGPTLVINDNRLLTITDNTRILRTMDMKLASERVRYVTSRYPQLQGARLIPLSLVFLASAWWRAGGIHLPGDDLPYGAEAWFFAALGSAIVASYLIRRRYARSLGSVGQHATRSAAIPILGTCALVAFAVWLQGELQWRLSLPAISVAAVLLATGLAHRRFRVHYVAAGAVLLAYSALGLFGVGPLVLDASFDAVIGIVLLIAGVGDHLLLTRTLHPPAEGLA